MRRVLITFIFSTFLITCLLSPKITNQVKADQYFDTYGNISWEEEKARLTAFAIELKYDSNMIGYIGFYIGKKDKADKIKARINRAKKYLIRDLKIKESRVKIIELGMRDEALTILQPVQKDKPSPFS
jgi:hypothetical protein